MHLGDVIKEYRTANNLSMQAFSDKCGLSKGYIAMLERNVNSKTGEPVIPSVETFIKVAKVLNINLADLFLKVDENRPIDVQIAPQLKNNTFKSSAQEFDTLAPDEQSLIVSYNKLNDAGQEEALNHMDYLLSQDRYKK